MSFRNGRRVGAQGPTQFRHNASKPKLADSPVASAIFEVSQFGVPIRRLTLFTCVISGCCAGLAGLLLLSMNGQGYVDVRDPVLVVVDRGGGVSRGKSILGGQRQLSWRDRRRDPAGDNDGADHCRERLGGLAQFDSRLPDLAMLPLSGRGQSC